MDPRLGRSVAIIIVITVMGGLILRGCAHRIERQLASSPMVQVNPADTASGPPDSARAVQYAVRALETDYAARGEAAGGILIIAVEPESAGFRVELVAQDGAGTRAQVQVDRAGRVELRHLTP